MLRFNEPGPTINKKDTKKILDLITGMNFLPETWILICGSLPPGMPENFYGILIDEIKKKSKSVYLGLDADCNFLKYGISSIPDLIKPNIIELERLLSKEIKNLSQLRDAGKMLLKKGISYILVTLGKNGAAGFSNEGFFYARGPSVKNAGCVGCGDVFLAGFALSFSETKSFKESLRFATAAATAKAAERFTDIPEPIKVRRFLKEIFVKNFDEIDGKIKISELREVPV
ncbi:MAG: PfkB family carbohydrate kinase [bacterium]|nr:PfkB family carbohydrate kinase [bacterium]